MTTTDAIPACPSCGTRGLYGPAKIVVDDVAWRYYDCPCCHSLVLEHPDGTLTAKAGAW